jgi:hypothetical protein
MPAMQGETSVYSAGTPAGRTSVIERYPYGTVSSKLKKRIERHYGVSFELLAHPIDSAAVLALLKQQLAQANRPEELTSVS